MGHSGLILSFGAFALALGVMAPPAHAQVPDYTDTASTEEAQESLRAATRRLAQDPRDLNALRMAGFAALDLNDDEAAQDYFSRAQALARGDARILLGLAVVAVRTEDPYQSLSLFERAEASGAQLGKYWGDRGLAYDLVGDTARAQQAYRAALSSGEDAVVTRRMALSQAIDGNIVGAESTLLPLLQRGNRAAFRTRAFVLAIAGRADEAMAIVKALQPPAAAARFEPYLRRMPALTAAQQAAAANFGHFPRNEAVAFAPADPTRSRYEQALAAQRGEEAPSRLEPQGPQLGPAVAQAQPSPAQPAPAVTPPPAQPPAQQPALATAELPPISRTPVAETPVAQAPAASPVTQPVQQPVETAAQPVAEAVVAAIEEEADEVIGPTEAEAPRPTIEIVRADMPPATNDVPPLDPAPAATVAVAEEPASLDEAFSSFRLPAAAPAAPTGGVDITAIQPPRERAAPPPPAAPSRQWVQVATGRDRDALRFDWRRIRRAGGELLEGREAYVATWGETNRLVFGPFDSAAAANKMVSDLKALEIDSFRFTSAEGEAVDKLP